MTIESEELNEDYIAVISRKLKCIINNTVLAEYNSYNRDTDVVVLHNVWKCLPELESCVLNYILQLIYDTQCEECVKSLYKNLKWQKSIQDRIDNY